MDENTKINSTDAERRARSDARAIQYFKDMAEWFGKADLDFLNDLYNVEKTSYEKGLKGDSAFLYFLGDYLKKSGKIQ